MMFKLVVSAFFFLTTITTPTFVRCSMFYTMHSDVKTSEKVSPLLQWHFNSTLTVSNGVCHFIQCYIEKNGSNISVGNWSVTSVEINPELDSYYNGRLSMSCDMKTVTLTISNPVYADSGKYFCMYKNVTLDVNLTVSGGPTFVSRNFSSTVLFNESVPNTVHVTYCGNPAPMVEWEFLGRRTISSYERIDIQDNSTIPSSQRLFCYRYMFITPPLSRHLCPTIIRHTVSGFSSPTTHTSGVVLRYLPEKLKDIETNRDGSCLLTTWHGPSVGPLSCRSKIVYDVRVKLKNLPTQTFSHFSSSFLLCNETINIDNISEISVRYRNEFGNGSFVSSVFIKNKIVSPKTLPTKEKSYENEFIAVLAVVVLALFMASIVGCVCLYKRCCSHEDGDVESKDVAVVADETPTTLKRQKKEKYNTIRKQDIVPKPRPMSHVITRPVSKSSTFHGMSTFMNRYSTDEATLHKAFMPMNTLQRRITDSLTAYNHNSASCQTLPNLSQPFVIENNNVDYNRLSAATESTTCSPVESRRQGVKENLSRMSSLDSVQSEYDSPRTIMKKKTSSNYDLPRCVALQNVFVPPTLTNRTQSMYDLPHSTILPFPLVNAKNNIKVADTDGYTNHRKVSEESATSDYSTPRNTIFEDDDDTENFHPDMKLQHENAYARPIDITEAIEKQKLQKMNSVPQIQSPHNITTLPSDNPYARPSDVCQVKNFEIPCSSRVDGLYDTPRNCKQRREQLLGHRAQSIDSDPTKTGYENYDELPRRATIATPSNLYDNIKNILNDKCVIANGSGIYEELPMKKILQTEKTQYIESGLADFSMA